MTVPTDGGNVRVLYIGGFGRSGSTLLELLLAQSADVTGLGEVVHLWRRGAGGDELCSCREAFSACPFWTAVGRGAFGGWDHLDLARVEELRSTVGRTRHAPLALARMRRRRRTPAEAEYGALYGRLYRAAREVSGGDVLVDSSKQATLACLLAREPGVDLRIVHLVRDSRGVAYSWAKHVPRPETGAAGTPMPRYSPLASSANWIAQNVLFDGLAAAGAQVQRMTYEHLVADPRAALSEVRTFAGLPEEPTPDPTTEPTPRTLHSVAGNPLRFRAGAAQVRGDEEWRTAMTRGDRALVTLVTAPLAARYGYLRPGEPGSTR